MNARQPKQTVGKITEYIALILLVHIYVTVKMDGRGSSANKVLMQPECRYWVMSTVKMLMNAPQGVMDVILWPTALILRVLMNVNVNLDIMVMDGHVLKLMLVLEMNVVQMDS